MTRFLPRFGVETTFVDGRDPENFRKVIRKNTRVIYLESPNSLTFELQDIGVSWGGHESLVFPAFSFDEKRPNYGDTDNLIRFYVGLDEPSSLINDLEQAFRKIS